MILTWHVYNLKMSLKYESMSDCITHSDAEKMSIFETSFEMSTLGLDFEAFENLKRQIPSHYRLKSNQAMIICCMGKKLKIYHLPEMGE